MKVDLIKQKLKHELHLYIFYTLFLFVFFCAFNLYRRLILMEYPISQLHYGYAFIESLILAKIILLGQTFGLGERFDNKPLIIPTVYKTIVFTLFVMAFGVLEHFLMGFVHHESAKVLYHKLFERGIYEILARDLVMLFVFILFFALLEIDRVMGEGKLFALFFREREPER